VRVCFYHAAREWSGAARAFADAAHGLQERGYEVTVACSGEDGIDRRFEEQGARVIAMRTTGGWLRAAWRLQRVLRREFVEVVFVHTEQEQLVAAAAVRLADRGAVVRRVAPLGSLALGRDAALAMRLAATGFLFAFEDDLRSVTPPSRALAAVVAPPGIALPVPAPGRARAPAPRTIVCLFDEARRGRAFVAIRTVALLAHRHPDLRAAFIGPGIGDDTLRLQAAALGIAPVLRFVDDRRDHVAVRDLIAGAWVGWVLGEGDAAVFGMLDCLAAGVPVLADRDPLASRLVQDDVCGLLAAIHDPTGLAALLASLFADDARHARLAGAARASAERWPIAATTDGFERATVAARDRTRWRG